MTVSTAIILAAGQGTRLGALTRRLPKALVRIDGQPIIFRLCGQLVDAGIAEIVIVVGHLGHRIMRALGPSHRGCPIRYIGSNDFATSNNVTSLALASAWRRPILICDCDIVLEALPSAWLHLTECDLAVPVRHPVPGETGCVLKPIGNDRWSIGVVLDPVRVDPGLKKSLSLYIVFNPALLSAIYDGCIAAVDGNEVDLYYEDIIGRVAAPYATAAIDVDAAGYRSFEIDRPTDLQRAEEFMRKARSREMAGPGDGR
jgi:CTP:molybdopterin cytidylyltransferase MocA